MSTTGPNYEAEYEAFHQNMMDLQHYEITIKEILMEMLEDLTDCDILPDCKASTRYWMFELIEKLPKDKCWEEWIEKNLLLKDTLLSYWIERKLKNENIK